MFHNIQKHSLKFVDPLHQFLQQQIIFHLHYKKNFLLFIEHMFQILHINLQKED